MLGRLSATAAVCLWCIAGPVQALGLGDMQVKSGLGQRLTAVIPFDSLTADEAESIRVSLARNDQFEQAGLERSAYLSSLKFEVITDQGAPRIELRSNEIAREPLIHVLVEARTAGGPRVLRQYTVFLDPPAQPVEPTPAPQVISQPVPSAPPVYAPTPEITTPAPVPETEAAAAPVWEPAEPAQAAPQVASTGPTVHGPIQEGEALWAIANSRKATGVGQSQAMLAIYEANRSAFLNNNINVLRKGVTLEIPSEAQMRAISESAAVQRLAQLRSPTPLAKAPAAVDPAPVEPLPEPSATPPVVDPASDTSTATEVEAASAPGEAAKAAESASVDASDQTSSATITGEPGSAETSETQTAPIVSTAEAEASDDQAKDAAAGEKAPWTPPAETEVSDPAVAGQAEPVEASNAEVEAGDLEAELADEFPLEPDTRAPLLGKLWIALIALIALIAALFGISSMRKAREQRAQREYEQALGQAYEGKAPPKSGLAEGAAMAAAAAATASQAHSSDSARAELERMDRALDEDATEQPPESELDEDITGPYDPESGDGILSASAEVDLGENDPVSEADFHLAYGLYDEAAIMLKRAAEAEPERTDIRVKLAETYFAAGDAQNFAQAAEPLKEELDAKEWGKLAIMGRQLCPGVALFASNAGDADGMSVDLSFDDVLSGSSAPGEVDEGLEFKLEELELPTAPSSEERSAREPDSNDLEFDLGEFELGGNDQDDQSQLVPEAGQVKAKDFDLSDSDLGGPGDNSLDISFDEIDAGLLGDEAQESDGGGSDDGGDAGTKLDLARAYVEMGDSQMARSLLDEVDASGDDEQKKEAAELRGRLSE